MTAVTAEKPLQLTYTHEAMIDVILANPTVTPTELATVFERSRPWIMRVTNSDSFNARLAQRKAALVDPILAQTLNNRLRDVAMRSLAVVNKRLDEPKVSAEFALQALDLASRNLSAV